jgi:hypothetical protein
MVLLPPVALNDLGGFYGGFDCGFDWSFMGI